jgi:multiple sugar transport system permease protein
MGLGLMVALILNQGIRGQAIFRTMYFLPVITSLVAASIIWKWVYQGDYGLANYYLMKTHIISDNIRWLSDPSWSMPAVIIMSVWKSAGFAMVVYLAGLQAVPANLYEAAEVDGAGAWVKLRHVTIPMISPAILFNLIVGAIAAFQAFTQAYVIGNGTSHATNDASIGGIQNSMLLYGLNLYNNAFRYFQMGYGSALAWVLLVAILLATIVMLRVSRNRVYYESER